MSIIANGTRSDEARARVEDRNNLTAKNMIYIGTGVSETINGNTVYQTEGKDIIAAINEAGGVDNAKSATTADQATYATNAGSATTADQATYATNAGNLQKYNCGNYNQPITIESDDYKSVTIYPLVSSLTNLDRNMVEIWMNNLELNSTVLVNLFKTKKAYTSEGNYSYIDFEGEISIIDGYKIATLHKLLLRCRNGNGAIQSTLYHKKIDLTTS